MATYSTPDKVAKEIETMIKQMDKNNNGKILWNEVCQYFRDQKVDNKEIRARVTALFQAYDADEDGEITVAEVSAKKIQDYIERCEKTIAKDIKELIDEYDTDGDGKLTYDEVFKVFEKDPTCGGKQNAKRLTDLLFSQIDTDNDKSITRKEIRDYSIKVNKYQLPSQ